MLNEIEAFEGIMVCVCYAVVENLALLHLVSKCLKFLILTPNMPVAEN